MHNKPTPKPGILDITPYVGGKSKTPSASAIIKLSSNESPLGPSPAALGNLKDTVSKLHRYPDGGAVILREAISKVHDLPFEQIICGNGSDELICLLTMAYAGVGDEVLYSEHGFLMYKIYAQSFGATPVSAKEEGLRADVDALLAAVTTRTKIVFIANPNNPTGSYITKEEMVRLHQGLPTNVLLVIDDAYAEYVTAEDYSDGRELVTAHDNVVMLRTFSKIYGLSALRIGWGYVPKPIMDVLSRIRSPFNVNAAAIAAGTGAMHDTVFTQQARDFNSSWLPWLSQELIQLGLTVHPSIGNFILVEFAEGQYNASNANHFMMERGVIPREVSNYGLPNHLRITIGLEDENRAVVNALTDFLKS